MKVVDLLEDKNAVSQNSEILFQNLLAKMLKKHGIDAQVEPGVSVEIAGKRGSASNPTYLVLYFSEKKKQWKVWFYGKLGSMGRDDFRFFSSPSEVVEFIVRRENEGQ